MEVYSALAPDRPMPERLRNVLAQMHSSGEVVSDRASTIDRERPVLWPAEALDSESEDTAVTLKSLPASQFLETMCDFPVTGSSYKHTDRSSVHVDATLDVLGAYFAVGSDEGIIIASACAGENSGGQFKGQCSSGVAVPAGFTSQGFYETAENCSPSCFGCSVRCIRDVVRFETHFDSISDNVNFHDCADVISANF